MPSQDIAKVAAARKLLTLVFYGLHDGRIRWMPDAPVIRPAPQPRVRAAWPGTWLLTCPDPEAGELPVLLCAARPSILPAACGPPAARTAPAPRGRLGRRWRRPGGGP